MNSFDNRKQHNGVALVVSLLFLLVVTVISLIAASNSSMGLKMSTNMADASSSFQSAEAGVIAVLALAIDAAKNPAVDPTKDPLKVINNLDPFVAFNPATDHPLRNLDDGVDSMKRVEVFKTNVDPINCPGEGYSEGFIDCDYYRIESEHEVLKKARTQVNLGVVKTYPKRQG